MAVTKIVDPEVEKRFKASLLRDAAAVEELHYNLKHRKDDIFWCQGCPPQQDPMLLCSNASPAVLDDDHIPARLPTASSMASALLPELLLEIFSLLVLGDPPLIHEAWNASETKIITTPHLGWIHVTHVCSRWRHLAVGTAALWTNFSHGLVLGPSWMQAFITRVKGAIASIPAFEDYPQSIDMICDYIMAHSPHIRTLSLSAEWTSMEFMWTVCILYLPRAISANLDTGRSNWHNPPLFGGYAPILRHLRLYNIIPWKCHSFLGSLTELDVYLFNEEVNVVEGEIEPIPPILLPPFVQVLDVLDEASRLERLSLHYAVPADDFTAEESRKVHFPHLKFFSMGSLIRDCVSFLKRLDMPSEVTLDLTCIPGLSREKFQDLFHVLAPRFYSAGDQCSAIERLELGAARFDDRALIRVYGGHVEMEQKFDDRLARNHLLELSHSPPKPMITLSLAYASPEDSKVILQDFFSLTPLQGLVYLRIYGCSTIQPEGWRSIIGDNCTLFQSVRFLVLGHDCTQYFFHAIHDRDDFVSGFGPIAFPNLDRLIFRRVDFSMVPRGDVSEASFQDQMLYHLRARIRRGKPLQAVFFFSCQGIEEEWLRDLEEVVKFVRLGL